MRAASQTSIAVSFPSPQMFHIHRLTWTVIPRIFELIGMEESSQMSRKMLLPYFITEYPTAEHQPQKIAKVINYR